MAVKITEECIACGACEAECPNEAIYEAGKDWVIGGETKAAITDEHTYIVPDKCTECVGFHDEPQCAAVCPVDCCVDDENIRETREELLAKKDWLHANG